MTSPTHHRLKAAVDFVTQNPGVTCAQVIAHLLRIRETESDLPSRPSIYKQCASVVERMIAARLVRQGDSLLLHPWDPKLKAYAEALERAAFAAPDRDSFVVTMDLAISAWRRAGDPNRARILENQRAREAVVSSLKIS